MALIFVYGSLLKGGPAHRLLNDCKYLGRGRVDGYTLLNLQAFPGAVPCKEGHVWGELYSLPDNPQPVVDALERYEGSRFYPELVAVSAKGVPLDVPATMFVYVDPIETEPQLSVWSPRSRNWEGPDRRGTERLEELGV